MIRLKSHLVGVEQGSEILFSDFEHDGPMWTGDGPRESRHSVVFSEPFRAIPMVQVAISMWDMAGDTNQRADLRAEKVAPEGFDLVFRTWGDSRVARIRADWMAIGPLADDEMWQVD